MRQIGLRWRLLACAGLLAGWGAAAAAAPHQDDAGVVKELTGQLSRWFTLPPTLQLDPSLRAAAEQLGAAHLARMEKQFAAWAEQERKARLDSHEQVSTGRVMYVLTSRMLNELAYWNIEPGDADYEKATLEALRSSPLVCNFGAKPYFAEFSKRILRIQAMPSAEQQAALASEKRMLERWGKPRPEALPWPNPLPRDAALRAVAKLAAGTGRPAVALPPHLAEQLLSAGDRYDELPGEVQCAVQRWWLSESLAQGQSPAAVLNAFRYGTLVTAAARYGGRDEPPAQEAGGRPAYPQWARSFEVEGVTRISREFDASGKPVGASVVGRKIRVAALPGVRPIAFEDAFDAVSVNFALAPAATAKPGSAPTEFDMVWSLEPARAAPAGTSAAAAATAATKKRAGKNTP